MIPRIIHQIWMGPKKPPTELIQTWSRMNPGWKHWLWSEKSLPRLRNQERFDWLTSYTAKSDLARYELLWHFGGVYADTDIVCLRPLDEFLERVYKPIFVTQDRHFKRWANNGLIGCPPKHPLLGELVGECGAVPIKSKTIHGCWTTGPKLLSRLMERYPNEVQQFPWQTWQQPLSADRWNPDVFGMHACSSGIENEADMRKWKG